MIPTVAPLENDQERQARLNKNQLLLQKLMNSDGEDPRSIEQGANIARSISGKVRLDTETGLVVMNISQERLRNIDEVNQYDQNESNAHVSDNRLNKEDQKNDHDKSESSYEEFVRTKTMIKGSF